MLDLRSLRLYSFILFSPIYIAPSVKSIILSRQLNKVDFPAPVLPTIPTFSPYFMNKFSLLIMVGKSFLYLAEKFLNSIQLRENASLLYPSSCGSHSLQYSS